MDDTVRSTFGYANQGAGYGGSGVKGLKTLLATISSASAAPVIVATRLQQRVGELCPRRRPPGRRCDLDHLVGRVGGLMVLRADSAY
jgi:hypothetical protein